MAKKQNWRIPVTVANQEKLYSLVKNKRNSKYWDYWEDIIRPKLEFIEAWARNGGSTEELARLLGIPHQSFKECIVIFPELYNVMQDAKFICEINIESALYQAACGYVYTETKLEEKQNPKTGQVQTLTTKTRKQVAPSIAAATFWLQHYGKNIGTGKLDREYKKKQLELLNLQIAQLKEGESQDTSTKEAQQEFIKAMQQAVKNIWSEEKEGAKDEFEED